MTSILPVASAIFVSSTTAENLHVTMTPKMLLVLPILLLNLLETKLAPLHRRHQTKLERCGLSDSNHFKISRFALRNIAQTQFSMIGFAFLNAFTSI